MEKTTVPKSKGCASRIPLRRDTRVSLRKDGIPSQENLRKKKDTIACVPSLQG